MNEPADIVSVSFDGPVRLPGARADQVLDPSATIRRQASVISGQRKRILGNMQVIDQLREQIAAFEQRKGTVA